MRITVTDFFALLLILVAATNAQAVCGTGQPAKYFSTVFFLGNNRAGGGPTFDSKTSAVSKFMETFPGQKHYALGGRFDQQLKKVIPSLRPAINAETSFFHEASPDGIKEIARRISAEFDAAKKGNKDFAPSDFQVTLFIENHGEQHVGKGGRTYALMGAPVAQEDGTASYLSIDEKQLALFAQALPPGIRLKTVTEVCYGADIDRVIRDNLPGRQDECACSVSVANVAEETMADYELSEYIAEKFNSEPVSARNVVQSSRALLAGENHRFQSGIFLQVKFCFTSGH